HAPDAAARDHVAHGRQPPHATTPLRPISQRVQPATSAPGARHANPGKLLHVVAAPVSGARVRTGVRHFAAGTTRAPSWTVLVETPRRVSYRDAHGRTHRIATHRRPLV